MEQQRFMFEEAHKQKDFIERMFADLLREQAHRHVGAGALDRCADWNRCRSFLG